MASFVNILISALLTVALQFGTINAVETTPAEATADMLVGLSTGDQMTVERYMDNDYVNFIENSVEDKDIEKSMREALFKNLSYDVVDIASRDDIAVAKVDITNTDFSGVMKKYKSESYDFVVNNLYEDKVTNKEKLSKECLEMYVDLIAKASEKDARTTTTVYIPLEDNGNYGWNVLLTDDVMKAVLGGLKLPLDF